MLSKIWKTKLKNHNKVKYSFLNALAVEEGEMQGDMMGISHIHKTDYFLKNNRQSCIYTNMFMRNISYNTNIRDLCRKKYGKDLMVGDIWYQQYVYNDRHTWHEHEDADIAMIYYLELDNPRHSTQFRNEYTKKTFFCNVAEGDIILFPANFQHRSPKITSDVRKTVIVANCKLVDIEHDS